MIAQIEDKDPESSGQFYSNQAWECIDKEPVLSFFSTCSPSSHDSSFAFTSFFLFVCILPSSSFSPGSGPPTSDPFRESSIKPFTGSILKKMDMLNYNPQINFCGLSLDKNLSNHRITSVVIRSTINLAEPTFSILALTDPVGQLRQMLSAPIAPNSAGFGRSGLLLTPRCSFHIIGLVA